jgi:hypothetical protein
MRGLAFALLILLTAGLLAAGIDTAEATTPWPAYDTVLDCWNSSEDVSLQISVRNHGTVDIPQGATIAYSYRMSPKGAVKNGSYKLDAPLRAGETRRFLVSPLQSWYPPIYQCSARVFRTRKSLAIKQRRN